MALADYRYEYYVACGRWFEHGDGNLHTWYHYLEAPRDLQWSDHTQTKIICTDEQLRRIRLLCGPHYKAVIAAWYVNNPLKETLENGAGEATQINL